MHPKILIALRERLGMSQRQFAPFLGVGRNALSRYERGECEIRGVVRLAAISIFHGLADFDLDAAISERDSANAVL